MKAAFCKKKKKKKKIIHVKHRYVLKHSIIVASSSKMHFQRNKCPCTLGMKSRSCTRGGALTLSGFKGVPGGDHGDRVTEGMKME